MGALFNLFVAMQWCRNQHDWVRLPIQGEARMLCEVVTMYGTACPITNCTRAVLCDGAMVFATKAEGM